MPQYSDTYSVGNGTTVNGVLNSESNTITYTVTAPDGKTASITIPSSADPQSVENLNAIRLSFRSQGVSAFTIAGFGGGLQTVKFNTTSQADKAAAASAATGTKPPDNPDPPPPVNKGEDPSLPPPAEDPPPPTELTVPPGTDTEEEGRQPGLEEPPEVTEEAINGLDLPPDPEVGVELTVPPGTESEEEGRQPGLEEPPDVTEEPINGLDLPPESEVGVELTVPPGTESEEEGRQPGLEEPPDVTEEPINGLDLAGSGAEGGGDELGGGGIPRGLSTEKTNTQTEATAQDEVNFAQFEDWRVRLSLAPKANYLYNSDTPGILKPLQATNGILFPYTPAISVQYAAHYDPTEIAHSNYKMYQYKSSSVDSFSITCDFTAQDTFEANYLLAVIHFLRSVTKMFYGQDQNPKRGTPPPLCYLTGLGSFQYDAHPLAITSFTYSLPTDVDYIRAGTVTTSAGVNKGPEQTPDNSAPTTGNRMTGIAPGGLKPPPQFKGTPGGTVEPTYVPTKMQIQIQAVPIMSRNDISNNFSLKAYASGELLKGMKGNKRISGGIW